MAQHPLGWVEHKAGVGPVGRARPLGDAQPRHRQDRRHAVRPRRAQRRIFEAADRRRSTGASPRRWRRATTARHPFSTIRSARCGTAACPARSRCRGGAREARAARASPDRRAGARPVLAAYGAQQLVIGHTPDLKGIEIHYGNGRLARIDTGNLALLRRPPELARDRRRHDDPPHRKRSPCDGGHERIALRACSPLAIFGAGQPRSRRSRCSPPPTRSTSTSRRRCRLSSRNRAEVASPGHADRSERPAASRSPSASRGITRATRDICDFPPLRVEFTRRPAGDSLFAGQRKLKLVTHCRNDAVVPAICAARICRLPPVQCAHSAQLPRPARERQLSRRRRPADRLRASAISSRTSATSPSATGRRRPTRPTARHDRAELSPADAARYALFQHMIANHDWSMRAGPAGKDCCHNAELIGPLARAA